MLAIRQVVNTSANHGRVQAVLRFRMCPWGGGFCLSPQSAPPFGLEIFETVRTGLVPILLIAGTLGIDSHFLSFLLSVLFETAVPPAVPL